MKLKSEVKDHIAANALFQHRINYLEAEVQTQDDRLEEYEVGLRDATRFTNCSSRAAAQGASPSELARPPPCPTTRAPQDPELPGDRDPKGDFPFGTWIEVPCRSTVPDTAQRCSSNDDGVL